MATPRVDLLGLGLTVRYSARLGLGLTVRYSARLGLGLTVYLLA